MFKIIADTSSRDLFIALVKEDKCIDYIIKKKLVKKTDVFPVLFKKLLDKNNLKVKAIDAFYCTNGPGSFTGSRTAFIFFKTICMINNKDLYLTSSLQFLAKAKINEEVAIDARSEMQYSATFKNKQIRGKVLLEISNKKLTIFNKEDFLENTKSYIKSFKKVKNLLTSKVNYVKHPSIGEVKK